MKKLLIVAAIWLGVASGQSVAGSPSEVQVLSAIGPWPIISGLIGYRGRLWFANSVRYPDHNSADIYSLDPATGHHRFERHLFSQDVGVPVVADGMLYWPHEDPRASMRWGHIAVTNGTEWQLRVMSGGPRMYHVHAMAELGGQLYAATSAWRAGLHASSDGGQSWRQMYDYPTPEGHITRIISLAGYKGKLFGAVVHRRAGAPRFSLLMLDGKKVTEIPGWPDRARTLDLVAAKGGVHGLVRDAGKVAFWRTDGKIVERIADAGSMPPLRSFTADKSGFWGVSDRALWHSGNGRRWRRVQELTGGKPIEIEIYGGQIYIGGAGSDGRGILWGPPPSPSLMTPAGAAPAWPPPRTKSVDWDAARAELRDAMAKPNTYRTRLRNLVYGYAMAGPPPGFFESALALPLPEGDMGMFGGRFKRSVVNVRRHILLWGMGVAGRGQVPGVLLARPWAQVSNRPQKWFDSLPMALFAVSWTRQRDSATLGRLITRLDRTKDPIWLKGDIIGALSAATGKRFGYDFDAWRQWWAEAKREWSR